MLKAAVFGLLAIAISACTDYDVKPDQAAASDPNNRPDGNEQVATFAGGCFWCMEKPYDKVNGVYSTTSGYIGGYKDNPTYKEVSAGTTGHTEAVQVVYDPKRVSYEQLLAIFWRNIDPTVKDRQFCDSGSQYRSGIFYHSPQQKRLAEQSKQPVIDKFGTVFTEITEATIFYPAEEYHQDYYQKNPLRYSYYRNACGRDDRLDELWGDQ